MAGFDMKLPKMANTVYPILGIAIISMLLYDIERQGTIIKQHEEDMAYIRENIDEVYRNTELANTRAFVIMDTLIRVFHYSKPHTEPVWCCPECSEILKKGRPNKNMPGERPNPPQSLPTPPLRISAPEKPINAKSIPSSCEHEKGKG